MIKTVIEIKRKKQSYLIPENWGEVTLKHLINLELWKGDELDLVGLLSCFIDVDPEVIANSKRDHWAELITVLTFVFEPPAWDGLSVPKTVKLDNRVIKVPRKLELERYGQKVLALQYMANLKTDSQNIAIIPDVMAAYFQPLIDGKFSRLRLDYTKRQVLSMPAFQAVPIGRFFFRKLLRSKNYGYLGLKASRLIAKKILYINQRAGIS